MLKSWRIWLCGFLVIGLLGWTNNADAQFGKLKKKVKDKVEKKVDDETDKKIDEALEGKPEETGAEESTEAEAKTETGEKPVSSATVEPAKLKPGEGAWVNYDFIPGDRVLYYEDFEKSPIGDFPERLEFEEGNMEVAAWEGSRYLRLSTNADFNIPLPGVLPERFTVEFDLYLPGGVMKVYGWQADGGSPEAHSYVRFGHGAGGITGSGGGEAKTDLDSKLWEDIVHCRIMGYKKYLKVYVNENRVANVPNADFIHSEKIHINLYNFSQQGILIGQIRVAEGGKKILYDALAANGRVATRGILFDSGSDNIRPESTPTLKQIGQMLQEHAELKLLIEGHTDNVGDDAFNQTLSEKRAAAVKAYIVSTYKVDEARLQTKGFGESNPVDSNATPEGRQNNRRVELVKL